MPPLLASMTAIRGQEIVLPSFISICHITRYPSAGLIAYGPFSWLGITSSGSKAFKELAPINRSTVMLSFPQNSSENLSKCFHCFSLTVVKVSLWFLEIFSLVKVDGCLIHFAFSPDPSTSFETYKPSISYWMGSPDFLSQKYLGCKCRALQRWWFPY